MALQSSYKKYNRTSRIANVETDFTHGMMFTEGTVSEGYVKTLVNFDYSSDGKSVLKPRASLRTDTIILPDYAAASPKYLSEDTTIKYVKECFEDGVPYYQIILGSYGAYDSDPYGDIWVLTTPKNYEYTATGEDGYSINYSGSKVWSHSKTARFYAAGYTKIHDKELTNDNIVEFPVGSFIGNSFYFFDMDHNLWHTEWDESLEQYKFVQDTLRTITASEAVNYGYNMLSTSPYSFVDGLGGAASFQMEGILPYNKQFTSNTDTNPELIMTPKSNTRIWFRCNYNIPTGKKYLIRWSWRELTTDNWTNFHEQEITAPSAVTGLPVLQADLNCPTKDVMVRCEAYLIENNVVSGTVEKAMTVGFDFSRSQDDTIFNTPQSNYDLSTASGMYSWKNRLILWGVQDAYDVLFLSEMEEPTYFPYPNNIVIFDNPIISVVELMDSLMVFTKDKIYKVSVAEDGISWVSEVIQSHLYIEDWDKHLILPVRNMLYFKSGNYYYMMVPKAQSTTGELTIAPITTPITDFFNYFSKNADVIFKDCFKYVDEEQHKLVIPEVDTLITYFNFLDYETVHNMYVYKVEINDTYKYVHFDISYNVVDRYWKINVYELPNILFPFKNDATQTGIFATTTVIKVANANTGSVYNRRMIQLYKFDPTEVTDLYLSNIEGVQLIYDDDAVSVIVEGDVVELPWDTTYSNGLLTFNNSYHIRLSELSNELLELMDSPAFISGYDTVSISDFFNAQLKEMQKKMIFSNKQLLDTGFMDEASFINKRYRELQLQINHMNTDEDMVFGMDFQIAGEPRNTYYNYEVSQVINEIREDEGIVYIDTTPYLPVDTIDIDRTNQWTIDHSLSPLVNIWKVRASISGKGAAPRLRLFTRDQFSYQLLGINWVYREMNMR